MSLRTAIAATVVTLVILVAYMAHGLNAPTEVPTEIHTALQCATTDAGTVICWEQP